MGKADKIKKNTEKKVAKRKVRSTISVFREQADAKEIEALEDKEYYQLFDDADEPMFGGNFMLGSIIKLMYKGDE